MSRLLQEIINEKRELTALIKSNHDTHVAAQKILEVQREKLIEEESLVAVGIDMHKITTARGIIRIQGDPYKRNSSGSIIALDTILDIANNFKLLRVVVIGNKSYEAFYQRCDSEYGMGPKHGSVVDSIRMVNTSGQYSPEEIDACIYYLKNFEAITKAKAEGKIVLAD